MARRSESKDVDDSQLAQEEEAEAQRLYQEFCEDIASGDAWGMNPDRDGFRKADEVSEGDRDGTPRA